MKKRTIFPVCIILFLVFSCKKEVSAVNPLFIGKWTGADAENVYIMEIQPDSQASYVAYKGSTQINVSGTAKIRGEKLRIFTKRFRIDAFPTKVSDGAATDEYVMTVDGIEYICEK